MEQFSGGLRMFKGRGGKNQLYAVGHQQAESPDTSKRALSGPGAATLWCLRWFPR